MNPTTQQTAGERLLLTATQKGVFDITHFIRRGDDELGTIRMSIGWKEKGTMTIGGGTYRLYREKLLSGQFLMEREDGTIVASAEKPGMLREEFTVRFGTLELELYRPSMWKRSFAVRYEEELIGQITPRGFLRQVVDIDMPENLPLELVAFIYWLVVLLWRRQQAAAG